MAEIVPAKVKALKLDIDQVSRAPKSILNANQIQKTFNSTLSKYKYSRPAKGGGNWTYVRASYVRRVLDSVFGFNWDFDIHTGLAEAFEVSKLTGVCVVKGTISARTLVDGQWIEISKTQFGRAEVKFKKDLDEFGQRVPLDFGNDMKAATSDCLKKCASLFGIASDVYEADEFIAIEITGADGNTDKAKQTKKKLKQIQKEMEATEV